MVRTGWRPRSVPEQLALVGLACVPVAFAWPWLHASLGLDLPCPLRRFTGVPCPLCGMTTAAAALADGNLGASLAANPFLIVLASGTLVMTVLMAARLAGRAAPARRWSPRTDRTVTLVVTVAMAVSWVVQLNRFGWL
jgi:hypothetical protein